jgi:hypothetical protein
MSMAALRRAARREKDIKQGSRGGSGPQRGGTLARLWRNVELERPERFVIFAEPGRFSRLQQAFEINLCFTRGLNPGVEKRSGNRKRLAMQALAIAAAGMSAAANRLGASAERVATWEARDTDADLAKEAVEQISAKNDFKANAAVIKTADEMIGALLDLKV